MSSDTNSTKKEISGRAANTFSEKIILLKKKSDSNSTNNSRITSMSEFKRKNAHEHFSRHENPVSGKKEDEKPVQRRVSNSPDRCDYCGRHSHADTSKCLARGATCENCGKSNHFANVCLSSGGHKANRIHQSGQSGRSAYAQGGDSTQAHKTLQSIK